VKTLAKQAKSRGSSVSLAVIWRLPKEQTQRPTSHQEGEYTMPKERLLVIGGDAAGMSAASQARRRLPELEIVAFERSPHTSYSA
jgi:hypothetical protein